jgi:CheY-like chemotaxis protein
VSGPAEILLVEDSPQDLELTLRVLKRSNAMLPIRVATDGAEALGYLFPEHARQTPPNVRLIILDLKLPRVSGYQVLERIKSDPRTLAIPVVVLTSSQEEADLATTYDLGANSYVVKPLDFAQFSVAVEQIGLYWVLLNKTPAAS